MHIIGGAGVCMRMHFRMSFEDIVHMINLPVRACICAYVAYYVHIMWLRNAAPEKQKFV